MIVNHALLVFHQIMVKLNATLVQRFYTPSEGSMCLKCPVNTYPSKEHKTCIPENHLAVTSSQGYPYLYHFSFFDTNLNDNSTT